MKRDEIPDGEIHCVVCGRLTTRYASCKCQPRERRKEDEWTVHAEYDRAALGARLHYAELLEEGRG